MSIVDPDEVIPPNKQAVIEALSKEVGSVMKSATLGLTLSCLIIQFFTDYIDRVVSLFLVSIFLKKVPISLWQKYQL